MGLFEHWPYVNFHDMNLDWVIKKIKNVETAEANSLASAEASAESAAASQLSADAALASQEAARQSELNAAESETNAAESEANAKNYSDHIADPVSGIVTEWLEENITPTTPAVDESLMVSGAAADAKVTGDYIRENISNIDSLKNNQDENVLRTAEWVIGSINVNGANQSSTERVRTNNYLQISYVKVAFTITEGYRFAALWYDESKQLIRDDYWIETDIVIFPPAGSKYLRLVVSLVEEAEADLSYANEITADGSLKSIYELNSLLNENRTTPINGMPLLTLPSAIKPDGTISTAQSAINGYHRTPFMYMMKGTEIEYHYVRATTLVTIAVFDIDGNFDLASSVGETTTADYGTFKMPYNGLVVLSCRNTEMEDKGSFIITTPEAKLFNLPPDNWIEYLETKKNAIKNALVAIGNTGISFTFVTDTHVPKNNMITPSIIKYLDPDLYVNYHINGGDTINYNTTSPGAAIDELFKWKKAMGGVTEYVLRGNHDNNNYDGNNTANEITTEQFYSVMCKQIENNINTERKTYYCIDNVTQKTRFICLDTTLRGTDLSDELTWLQTKLTELQNWTIMIIQHYVFSDSNLTIHNIAQYVINSINAVYDQMTAQGNIFVGILGGHTHVDENTTENTNGYLLITRDCNFITGVNTDSLSFDYVTLNTNTRTLSFIKIGRGSDLVLTY